MSDTKDSPDGYTDAIGGRRQIPPTRRGFPFDEAASSLQKCLRRGQEEDALYWALELDESGFTGYVWRRLLVITSEDIGLAEPHLPATIAALHQTALHLEGNARGRRQGAGRLQLTHAVLLLARARKSRIVNNALLAISADDTVRSVRPEALDRHTKRGRELGRDRAHFAEEASLVADVETGELGHEPHLPDLYRERAVAAGQRRRKPEPEQLTIEESER